MTRERVKVNPQKSRADKKLIAPADLGNLPANTGSFVVVSGKCCLPNGPEMPRVTGMSGMDVTEGHESSCLEGILMVPECKRFLAPSYILYNPGSNRLE